MKIIKFYPSEGVLKSVVKSPEDLIVLSYVIEPGDRLVSYTRRKIEFGKEKEIKSVRIGIDVERVELSESALSVSGKIFESSDEDVPLHKYHTIQLELETEFALQKKEFLGYQIKAVRALSARSPRVFICVYEAGYAIFYTLTNYSLKRVRELRESIPGKRFKTAGNRLFFDKLERMLLEKLKERWDLFIVAGTTMYNDKLRESLGADGIIYETVSYADTGLKELMDKDVVNRELAEKEILNQKKKMDEYLKNISAGDENYVYGLNEIRRRLDSSSMPEEAIVSKNFISGNKELLAALDRLSANIVIFNQQDESQYTLDSFGGIIVKFY
ncbi:MAG: hypothetical protein OH316_01275 [Candidatus Parvarchaeota archaeon]|nr:hypothetical protein [Candidatus Parvarchaeota archaeon]MCW1301749.1 hypothetical protein [Candidatus Parvarchaeota archaeon]